MNKRELRSAIRKLLTQANKEIAAHTQRGGYAAALAGEGAAGGYRHALYDILALMDDIPPPDRRNYWQQSQGQ